MANTLPKADVGRTNCTRCGRLNMPLACPTCKCCTTCDCRCLDCYSCGAQKASAKQVANDDFPRVRHNRKSLCRLCGQCQRAGLCKCRKRPKYHRLELPKTTFVHNSLTRALGLELEVSRLGGIVQTTRPNVPVLTDWVHDGSVKPSERELVVYPSNGDAFLLVCEGLGKYLKDSEANRTCGYHVHGNAMDYSPWDIRRLVTLYDALEPVFYKLTAPWRIAEERWINRYCKRLTPQDKTCIGLMWHCTTAKEIKRQVINWLYTTIQPDPEHNFRDFMRTKQHKYEACRYRGINLHTWFERGTIEFRHFQGTINPVDIKGWALWCGWFIELATKLKDSEIRSITNYRDLLQRMPAGVHAWVEHTLTENERDPHRDEPPALPAEAIERLDREAPQAPPQRRRNLDTQAPPRIFNYEPLGAADLPPQVYRPWQAPPPLPPEEEVEIYDDPFGDEDEDRYEEDEDL